MSQMGYIPVVVKVLGPLMERRGEQRLLQMEDVPPRSRLYGLAPREGGTFWGESLTSYLTRLAWQYRVNPGVLVAQELAPQLTPRSRAKLQPKSARSFNGNEPLALERVALLEALTQRTDLHLLTAQAWVGHLPMRNSLRERPSWCPACYAAWKEQGVPLYEPLLWMLKVVLICPRHISQLEDRCPNCQQHQSFLKAHTEPGHCIHCKTWLGRTAPKAPEQERDRSLLEWQEWILLSLEELRNAFAASGSLSWERFFRNLATYLTGRGEKYQLAKIAGLEPRQFMHWLYESALPPLERLLEFCKACGVTPLHVLLGDLAPLKRILQEGTPAQHPRPPRVVRWVDRKRCWALIQAVLEGREQGIEGVNQVAKRLGYEYRSLKYHFPDACRELTKLAQDARRQRVEQQCQEIRQAVGTLHHQGKSPSADQVSKLLSSPNFLKRPEAVAAWHAARREFGLEP